MRKYEKKQCADLIKSLEEAHTEITKLIEKKNIDGASELLEQCQQAAITIGEIIERSEGEGTEAVGKLEDYCEKIYGINQDITDEKEKNTRQIEKSLQKQIISAQNSINALPTRIEAVFLPYKASMWDSLESIWMAADEDPNCDAYVIPIPYYDKNPDGSFAKLNYEGNQYPDYVPIVNYQDYSFEEHHPDMIFIHNPYDQYNFVTSVHPYFYSKNLRELTECLVYVPYYATAGAMAEGQSLCSAYAYVDYIVVQSESMIGQFDSQIPKEKFLPLGSPKFDRVIRLCANPPEPPIDWRDKLEGRRVFFYNTSINGFLEDTPTFIKKMHYVFNVFKGREDVCLLWRPHPLLESTIESMRPELKQEYLKLKDYFINENIGILDESPDIEKTIAICDAYIGDAGTSITSLFGVAGKPIYILNNYIHEAPKEDDWLVCTSFPVRDDRNTQYGITMGNRLFIDRERDRSYRYLCDLSTDYLGSGYYGQVIETNGKIIAYPINAESILLIDPDSMKIEQIEFKHRIDRHGAFSSTFNLFPTDNQDTFYILPNRYPDMVSYNIKTHKVDYFSDEAFGDKFSVLENSFQERVMGMRIPYSDKSPCFLNEKTRGTSYRIENTERTYIASDGTEHKYFMVQNPKIKGISMKGPILLCIDVTGKRLRAVNLENKKAEEREFGLDGIYIGAVRDINNLDVFWFIPYIGTKLCKWNITEDSFKYIDAHIDGLKSIRRPQRYDCDEFYFSSGVFYKNKLILSPRWGNKFVSLDVNTYESKEWIPPFSYTLDDKNGYWKNMGIGIFVVDIYDWSYQYYYAPEHILYDIDMDNHSAKPVKVSFDKDEIYGLAPGFHRESQWMPYVCFEDVFNSLHDISLGNINGSTFDKHSQISAYCTINSSPSGDCGEKIYNYLWNNIH